MPKAITCSVILTSASTRADNSLSIRFCTPELLPEEKTAIFELQGNELKMLLQPIAGDAVELHDVKGSFDEKTPSQRLRAVLFCLWKQENEAIDFEVYYRTKVNGIIEHLKLKLNPT